MAFLSLQIVQRELIAQRLSWRRIRLPVVFAEEPRWFLLLSELGRLLGFQKAGPQVELSEELGWQPEFPQKPMVQLQRSVELAAREYPVY